jgi:glutamyl/glutaminyl-tRNA synthetase
MEQVIADLKWLGIDWDQGPGVEGPKGPYLQSQRRDIYDKHIKQLIEQGKAYYCFDTHQELEAMRILGRTNSLMIKMYKMPVHRSGMLQFDS